MSPGSRAAAVICAGGGSRRMGGVKKEYLTLPGAPDGVTVLGAAVAAFVTCPQIGAVVVVAPEGGENAARAGALAGLPAGLAARVFFTTGGAVRRDSVRAGLAFLEHGGAGDPPDWALIHDGARPWVTTALIERVLDAAVTSGLQAAIPVAPAVETPKEIDPERAVVRRHLRRATVGFAQTPQAFAFPAILRAHQRAAEDAARWPDREYTDDAEVWGAFVGAVAVVPGEARNRKITFPEDLTGEVAYGVL